MSKQAGNDVHKGNGSKSSQDEDKSYNKSKGTERAPAKQETDSHAAPEKTSKFLGDSKGNADRNVNLSGSDGGGGGESHPFSSSSPFFGETKGNKDLPIDLSKGHGGGEGGKYVAGRGRKTFSGNKGGF